MKRSFFALLGFVLVLFIGCENFIDPPISVQKQLSDSRFNGEFWYHGTGTFFSCWEFNGTNKAKWAVNTYHFIYDISIFEMEIKLENSHLWSRLWDNEFSDWNDEGVYSFDNAGNLTLNGIFHRKETNSRSIEKKAYGVINEEYEKYIQKKVKKL